MKRLLPAAMLCLSLFVSASVAAHAVAPPDANRDEVGRIVGRTIGPLMKKNGIAGMAVGVVVDGKPYVFDYGVASKATKQPVDDDTLFELGSVSKTFTATLTAYAVAQASFR